MINSTTPYSFKATSTMNLYGPYHALQNNTLFCFLLKILLVFATFVKDKFITFCTTLCDVKNFFFRVIQIPCLN